MESFVYFIKEKEEASGKETLIKIGKADDLERRLKTLQTGNSNQLILIGAFRCKTEEEAFILEKKFHVLFKKNHHRGEWFKYNDDFKFLYETIKNNYLEIYMNFFLSFPQKKATNESKFRFSKKN